MNPVLPLAYPTEPCPSCGAEVIWAISAVKLRSMPIDRDIDPRGNVLLEPRDGFPPLAKVLNAAQRFGRQGQLRTSHHMTCPKPVRRRR